jgi:hypothetical protein
MGHQLLELKLLRSLSSPKIGYQELGTNTAYRDASRN